MSEGTDQARPADEPPKVEGADATAPQAETAAPVTEAPAAEGQSTADIETFEEDEKSKKVTLADLAAKGTAFYAHKQYEDAAEVFSRASNLQAELNGELAPENAEILFHYGRSLFKVGQSKSDVLGGTAAGAKAKPNGNADAAPKASSSKSAPSEAQKVTQEGVAVAAENKEGETDTADAKKPLFQFTGDENFDDSDEEEEVRESCF